MRERVEAEGRRRAREDCREDAGASFSICPYQQDTAAAAAWWRGYWAEVGRVVRERAAAQDRWRP